MAVATTDPSGPALVRHSGPKLSRRRKAAIIVRLLLKDGADLRLDELPETLQTELTHEMGAIRAIDRETLQTVVEEFVSEVKELGVSFPGGLEGALSMLDGALSEDNLNRLRRETGVVVRGDPWEMIAALPPGQLAEILKTESVEIAAVILSKLPVAQSAALLGYLPGDLAREITYAVATTEPVDPETVHTIGHAIASQIGQAEPKEFEEAPPQRIGAILTSSKADTRDGVLTGIDEQDAQLGAEVRKAIFTFENIPDRIDGRDIPKIARAVDQAVLMTALAGCADKYDEVAEFMLENTSQRLAAQLRDEIADLGRVKPDVAEDAMSTVVGAIRDLEAAGEVTIIPPGEKDR